MMEALISADGSKLFARVKTNQSPVVMLNPSPHQNTIVTVPMVSATQNYISHPAGHGDVPIPIQIHASTNRGVASGTVVATRRDGDVTTPVNLSLERGRMHGMVVMKREGEAACTTPSHLTSDRGRASSACIAMGTRRDLEMGEGQQEESRLNMSRYSSVLNSLSDQDQASMDLEVQSVMFPESRGLLPTVKRICPSRSSSSSKASSKSSYSPMRQSTSFTNTKRGNIQTTTPTFPLVDQTIHQLAAQGEQALVAEKLDSGTDIDETDSLGHTALTWACQHNQTDMARFLLERNADPCKASMDGETGLALACSVGNAEVVRMMLSKKAPVNVYDYNGGTPLVYAVYHNHPAIVEMLLDSGADMTIEMESGHTPLSLSMVLGHKQVQRVIEQHMLSLLQIT